MNPQEKRAMCMKQLRSTFIRVAELDETISKSKLISEIIFEYDVSAKTAKGYLDELVQMGFAKERDDLIWYSKETIIRNQYLQAIKEADKVVKQQI